MLHKILGIGNHVSDDSFGIIEREIVRDLNKGLNIGETQEITVDAAYIVDHENGKRPVRDHKGVWIIRKDAVYSDHDVSVYHAELKESI